MFRKNTKNTNDEHLDRLGRRVVLAASLEDDELDQIAASPFLATRFRARIDSTRAANEESGDWLAIFGVAWRAVPAMALAAAIAVGTLFFAGNGETPSAGIFTQEELLATSESTTEDVYFDDSNAASRDEVLSTLVNENERSRER